MWKIVLLALLIFLGIIFYILYDFNKFFANSVTIIGWILFVIQTIISTVPKAKLFFERMKVYITNPTINWSLSVVHKFDDFDNLLKINPIEKIEEYLEKLNNFKIEKKNASSAFFTIKGYTIRVVIKEENNSVRIEIGDKDISYRESVKILDKLSNTLEEMNNIFKSDEQEYYISMTLESENPFKGILINHLNDLDIHSFKVKFNTKHGVIDIYNNSIELFATSLSNITNLSKNYLHVSSKE